MNARELIFRKVEGAGNDFVLLDGRRSPLPVLRGPAIRRLLDRHRGVGADGLLVLDGTNGAARVRYWNSDGGAAAFCGNGARCVALMLLRESPRRAEVEFRFGSRRLRARRAGKERVALRVPEPVRLPTPSRLPPKARGQRGPAAWFDSGVPHWIIPVSAVEAADLAAIAPPIRGWKTLGPGGTNVDLVEIRSGLVHVRTWERGVEGETQACGSGLIASGWWAATARKLPMPVRLRSRGGDRFLLRRDPDGALWLEGPARVVFTGRLSARLVLSPEKV